jgi:hypothetical protein
MDKFKKYVVPDPIDEYLKEIYNKRILPYKLPFKKSGKIFNENDEKDLIHNSVGLDSFFIN